MKCSIPKGTRDFLPLEMARRNYIFDTIRDVFRLFAFEPIETPALENLSTLTGKYGEEGDQLLFKVLNSGDFTRDVDFSDDYHRIAPRICERGLRYDLTVPFARFVVQHREQITFPFRRYQLQPVWRADRPQKGRYREFYQCDADMIGSDSLLNELELVQMIDEVFARLGISVTLKINNRKILAGIADLIGAPDKLVDITTAIDKLDKIGLDAVRGELADRGLAAEQIAALDPIFALQGTPQHKLDQLKNVFDKPRAEGKPRSVCAMPRRENEGCEETNLFGANSETQSATGLRGVEECETLFNLIAGAQTRCSVELDLTLARGLNYYTGAIFEVKANDVAMGSICGGGRYDNLTGIFGMPGVSGVGISFGADRVYDVLTELDAFPPTLAQGAKVLFTNFGAAELAYTLPLAAELRRQGVPTLIYPDTAKVKKQMEYANRRGVAYVVFVGEQEVAAGTLTIKNMTTGDQQTLPTQQALSTLASAE